MIQIEKLVCALGVVLFVSCHDAQVLDPQEDYIIFGQFNGYCIGEACIEFYRLEDDRLLESAVDEYSGTEFYPFEHYAELADEKFELVKDLGDFFPQGLWIESATHIGHADAADVGELYFEIRNDSIHRYWVFENGDFEMKPEYTAFMNKIVEKIALIHQ